MKRIKLFVAIAAAVMSTACNKEQVKLQLNTTEVTLYSGDEHTITSPNGSNLKFSSRDRYIANVNETTGLITAITIGETTIDVSSDQGTAEVKVTVRPKYNTFKEPCTDFTKTKSDLIAMFGTPDQTNTSGISYYFDDNVHPMDIYLLESNGRLKSSCAMINQDYATQAMKFLAERYIPVTSSDGVYLFANGIDKITMGITLSKVSGYRLYQIIYMPYDDTKAGTSITPSIELPSEFIYLRDETSME